MAYVGIRVKTKSTVEVGKFAGALTDETITLTKNEEYMLQFKIVNYSSNNILNHIVATKNGTTHVISSSMNLLDFKIVNTFEDEGITKNERLCYMKFIPPSDGKYRIGICRTLTVDDKPSTVLFDVTDVGVERGRVLQDFKDNSKDLQDFMRRCQTYFEMNDKRIALMAKREDVNKAYAGIEVTADGIKEKVSKIEYDKNNKVIKNQIVEIDKKADGISQKVTKIEGDYVTSTEFKQSNERFDFEIYDNTNINLMLNSSFEKEEVYTKNHPFALDFMYGGEDGYPITVDGGKAIRIFTNGGDSYFIKETSITIEPNTSYVISYYYACSHGREGSNYIFINDNPVRLHIEYVGDRGWHRAEHVVNIPDNVNGITSVRFGIVAQEASWLMIDMVQIEKSGYDRKASKFRPNSEEVCVANSFIDKEGVGVKHIDGSYTKMLANGFRRFVGSIGYEYHYLTYIGKTQKLNLSPVTVQLPDDFKNKDFKVTLSLEEVANPAGWFIQSLQLLVSSIDKVNATFQIIGGSQSQFHDGTQGTMQPTTISYTVTA